MFSFLLASLPVTGDAATQVLLQIVMNDPRDIAEAATAISRPLAMIVRRCMQKQAADRYQNCEELQNALSDSLRNDPSREHLSQVPTLSKVEVPAASPGFRPAAPPPPRVPTAPPTPAVSSLQTRRALVADDDPSARYILGSVLRRNQIDYDEAANGADAVKLLKSNTYAFVFIDLLMPRIDGWGVLDFLRSHRPNPMPRTIIITGVQNQKLSTADQDIVSGLLYKPIDIDAVEKLL